MKKGLVVMLTTLFLCPSSYGQEQEGGTQSERMTSPVAILTWVSVCLEHPEPCIGATLTVNEYGDDTYEFVLQGETQNGRMRLTRQSAYFLYIPKWIVAVNPGETESLKAKTPETPE